MNDFPLGLGILIGAIIIGSGAVAAVVVGAALIVMAMVK